MPFTGRSADHVWAIDYFLAVWFVLAGLSTAWVAWDQFRHNPEPAVMKWGFHSGYGPGDDAIRRSILTWLREEGGIKGDG